jgi:hypothetical protein
MLPNILMNMDFAAEAVPDEPGSGVPTDGSLLLLGVGRMLIPFTLSPWVLKLASMWL